MHQRGFHYFSGRVGGLENWRVMLISAFNYVEVEVEVEAELGKLTADQSLFSNKIHTHLGR